MRKLIVPVLAAALTLCACNNTQKPESFEDVQSSPDTARTAESRQTRQAQSTATPVPALTEDEMSVEPVVKKETSSAKPEWEVVREYSYDMNGDGNPDRISLYTSAIREEGVFLWDDTHSWCLEVKTGEDSYYPLYTVDASRSVVYFSVGEQQSGDTIKPVVYLYDTSGTNVTLEQFTFEGDGFVKRSLYDSKTAVKDGVNIMYSSIPQYGE